jgi:hypothetical protein
MNPRLSLLLAAVLSGLLLPAAAQQAPPAAPVTPPENKPATAKKKSPERAAMYRYLAKNSGKPEGQRSRAATRNGPVPPVTMVALAPDAAALTLLAKPRIWWWQSVATRDKELEFSLTRMGDRPGIVFTTPIGPLEPGYNAIDLSQASANPRQVALEPGVDYKWTLTCLNGLKSTSVSVRIRLSDDKAVAAKFAKAPLAADTVNALSAAGNWYELFDTVAVLARIKPQDQDLVAIRQSLLDQVGLNGAITAK